MKTPGNHLPPLFAYTALLLGLFLLTAWRAIDDPAVLTDLELSRKTLTSSAGYTGKTAMEYGEKKSDGLIFPAGIDAGRMLITGSRSGRNRDDQVHFLKARDNYQPTITNATFPVLGDKLRTAVDLNPSGIVGTAPGGGQNWDYSNLITNLSRVDVYQAAASGAAFARFPTADLLTVENSGTENYWDVTANAFSLLGRSGYSLEGNLPINMKLTYNPPFVERRAPLSFLDLTVSSSGVLEAWIASSFPTSFLSALPFVADSIRLRISINRFNSTDAYGFLSIPGGTYEVLRQKSTRYKETRLDAKIAPLGWLDVTDLAIQYVGFAGGVDTLVSYSFYNNMSKEPVALCRTDNSQLLVTQVEFKDLNPACLHVTSNLNTGTGSLRQAFACSLAGDTIRFDAPVFNQTIALDLPGLIADRPLFLFANPGSNITISNLNAANTGVLLNIQDQLTVSGLKILGQTPESMIFQLGPSGGLNLTNSEVNRFTLQKN